MSSARDTLFPKVCFESSLIRAELFPDSRGNVLFSLTRLDRDDGKLDILTCEYLSDLAVVSLKAMQWIDLHCEEIKYGDRHLYYKFKEPFLACTSRS